MFWLFYELFNIYCIMLRTRNQDSSPFGNLAPLSPHVLPTYLDIGKHFAHLESQAPNGSFDKRSVAKLVCNDLLSIWNDADLMTIAEKGIQEKILKFWESRNDKSRRTLSCKPNRNQQKKNAAKDVESPLDPEVGTDRESRASTNESSQLAASKERPKSRGKRNRQASKKEKSFDNQLNLLFDISQGDEFQAKSSLDFLKDQRTERKMFLGGFKGKTAVQRVNFTIRRTTSNSNITNF